MLQRNMCIGTTYYTVVRVWQFGIDALVLHPSKPNTHTGRTGMRLMPKQSYLTSQTVYRYFLHLYTV